VSEEKNNESKGKAINADKSKQIKETLDAQEQVKEWGDSHWSYVQKRLQDIQAEDRVNDAYRGRGNTPLTKQLRKLKEHIKNEFANDPALVDAMLKSIPSYSRVRNWLKDEKWERQVRSKMSGNKLFGMSQRAAAILAVYKKAVEKGDVRAMELYLKMSGDLETGRKAKETERNQWKRLVDGE